MKSLLIAHIDNYKGNGNTNTILNHIASYLFLRHVSCEPDIHILTSLTTKQKQDLMLNQKDRTLRLDYNRNK